jgi:N-acetylmuramoyl-L-alanine amidase
MARTRRELLGWSLKVPVLLAGTWLPGRATAASILAVRLWPAQDYTRVTIELDQALKYKSFRVPNPERVVVDLEGISLDGPLKELVSKLEANDPYIASVRVGEPQNNTVRIAFDLKVEVLPQIFTQEPVGIYKHRLLIDFYPRVATDPLAQLIARAQTRQPATNDPIADLAKQAEERALERQREQRGEKPPAAKKPSAPPPVASKRMVTIAIDPGHGGEDPGAVGAEGTREKDVVLLIAKKLRDRIEQEPNMRVYMTRDADFFVPLATRVHKARQVKADLFVSVHADAFDRPEARGASVFILSDRGASSSSARWLANKENAADLVGGVNIKNTNREAAKLLLSMSTEAQIRDSSQAAKAMLAELGQVGQLHKNAVEQASFAVLRAPDIPSVLVETAFISNHREEQKLRDPAYQDKVANAVFKGIQQWLKKNPLPVGKLL